MAPHNKKTHAEYVSELNNKYPDRYVVLSEYRGVKYKITIKYLECGHEAKVAPVSPLNGRGCARCVMTRVGKSRNLGHRGFTERLNRKWGNSFEVLSEYTHHKDYVKVKHIECGYKFTQQAFVIMSLGECPACKEKEFKEYIRQRSNNQLVEYLKESGVHDEYVFFRTEEETEKVSYLHLICGKFGKIRPAKFKLGQRCPRCRRSLGEEEVEKALQNLGVEYETQKSIGNALRADFYLPNYRAYIEYDGEQHYTPVKFWGGTERHDRLKFNDSVKNNYCKFLGFPLLRIPYWEFENIEEKLKDFIDSLEENRGRGTRNGEQ